MSSKQAFATCTVGYVLGATFALSAWAAFFKGAGLAESVAEGFGFSLLLSLGFVYAFQRAATRNVPAAAASGVVVGAGYPLFVWFSLTFIHPPASRGASLAHALNFGYIVLAPYLAGWWLRGREHPDEASAG